MALTGIKFRAYPTAEQAETLSQWIGCARFIYNAKCDDDKYYRTFLKHSLTLSGERIPVDQTYSQYKTENTTWLDDCPSQLLRNSAVIWYQAYQNFFQGRAGRPKKKRKGQKDSIWLTSELFKFDDGKLFIGAKTNNIGYLSFDAHKDYKQPKSVTISRKNGEWFVSFNYEDNISIANPIEIIENLKVQGKEALSEASVGLDRGVIIPLQASTGERFDFTPQQKASIERKQRRIKRWQRRLTRQQKGSKRRNQTKLKLGRAHQKIGNVRKDFAHKTSRKLADSDKTIFIAEDLKTKNMTKRAKAKQDENGEFIKNGAAAKAGLNAAILNSAWGAMILFLAYKAAKIKKVVIKIKPHHSSQQCARCNHIHPDNRQSQAEFECQNCGHTENADLQASKVLRSRGVEKILSAASHDWKVESDQSLKLAAGHSRGTRRSARGGNRKTQRLKTDALSQRSANLVVVAQAS